MMSNYLADALQMIHTLSAASWFGALVYRTFFVDPKLRSFLGDDGKFEHASLHLAHGMCYVVFAALTVCGLSGFALVGLRWNEADGWMTWMIAKTAIWLVAFAVFVYISWVFWPKRVFADAKDWLRLRRQGLAISLAMIGLAGLGFVLGRLGQSVRLMT